MAKQRVRSALAAEQPPAVAADDPALRAGGGLGRNYRPTLRLLADLNEAGASAVVARGGRGGRGNASLDHSKLGSQRDDSEAGVEGQTLPLLLELKAVADVGLVGAPNVGKSTLLVRPPHCALRAALTRGRLRRQASPTRGRRWQTMRSPRCGRSWAAWLPRGTRAARRAYRRRQRSCWRAPRWRTSRAWSRARMPIAGWCVALHRVAAVRFGARNLCLPGVGAGPCFPAARGALRSAAARG